MSKRNPKEDGVYALKGKIKNCKNIGDLSDNKEILELMHILGLDPSSRNNEIIGYKRIVIATDPDPDGSHITSLLINLFYKWFPTVIRNKRGRKPKVQFDPRRYDNDYLTLWEDLIEGEKVLIDNDGNVYTFNTSHPILLGKKDVNTTLNFKELIAKYSITTSS